VMPPLASQNPAVQVERFRKDNDRFDVELALRKSITNKLHEANIRFEDMILNVLPNLTAECKIFRPKGATQENYSDQIEGEVQIEYVGNGIWEVRGTKDLKDIQVDISTPVSMYHIVQVEEKGFKGQSFESNNFELKPDMKLIYVKSETPFYVSKYEVTVAQYNQFLNELKQGKYKHERCYEPNCQRSHIPRPWPRQEPNHPVSGITWFDAYAFCKWLGPEYQLPSRMHYRCMVFNDPHTSLKPINEFISGDGININKNDDINVKGIVGLFSSVKEYTIDHSTDLPGREDDIYIFESDVNRSNIAFAHLTPYGRDKIFGFRVVKPANKISPDQVETESLDKEKSKTAKVLRIVVYEGDKPQPDVTLIYPLAGLKIANTLIPEQAKEQMAAQGIDLGEVIKQVDNGLGPTTLLDVKDGNEHVIISLE
jgi:hypothetical protein